MVGRLRAADVAIIRRLGKFDILAEVRLQPLAFVASGAKRRTCIEFLRGAHRASFVSPSSLRTLEQSHSHFPATRSFSRTAPDRFHSGVKPPVCNSGHTSQVSIRHSSLWTTFLAVADGDRTCSLGVC